MKEDWVPIQVPDNFEAMIEDMSSYVGDKVGWCLLCNCPIRTASDMIPDTNTHNCEQGRAFEQSIRGAN
jgi:hypothetical protein